MSSDARREYLIAVAVRYRNARKKDKTKILDEFCATTGWNRKHAITRLNGPMTRNKPPGRKTTYSHSAILQLVQLWKWMNYMNSKNLVAALPFWLEHYDCPEAIKRELLAMSAATVDRKLKPYRAQVKRAKRSGTKPGKMLRFEIPIKPFDHKITQPGFIEADTVAHCGGSLMGEFAWSLTCTDILTGWTEVRAVWNKRATSIVEALREVESGLPFSIYAFNCDNGSEFINHEPVKYFGPDGEKKRLHQMMTRSREYKKNDNCHVEQKNWTHVRQLFGYRRIDAREFIDLMNDIYRKEQCLLQNFFIPQVKLKTKLRVGAKYKRTYTKPRTPYQALIDSPDLPLATKERLKAVFASLNPFDLQVSLEKKLARFYQALSPNTERKAS
jgi:hypothetical protein